MCEICTNFQSSIRFFFSPETQRQILRQTGISVADFPPVNCLVEPFHIDSASGFHYSIPVKWLILLICFVLLHDIFIPPSTSVNAPQDGQPAFSMIDVCHSSAPQVSEDDEMPTVAERSDAVVPVPSLDYTAPIRMVFIQFLLASQNDRPPEA